jgi:hypothetical protein
MTMRKLPTILAGLFIAITLARVASFSAEAMQAGVLGWIFSIGLGLSVYASAYWTRVSASSRDGNEDRRSRSTRVMAWIALVLFAVADGFFNLAEVLRTVTDSNLRNAAILYGAFPTLAAALLGALQGYVDRLPVAPQRNNIPAALRAYAVGKLRIPVDAPQLASVATVEPQLPAKHTEQQPYKCGDCGRTFAKQNSLAAHARVHAREKRRNG